jgi:hypothetical protein
MNDEVAWKSGASAVKFRDMLYKAFRDILYTPARESGPGRGMEQSLRKGGDGLENDQHAGAAGAVCRGGQSKGKKFSLVDNYHFWQ